MDANSDQMKALLSELQVVLEKYNAHIIADNDHNVNVVLPTFQADETAVFGILNDRLAQVRGG